MTVRDFIERCNCHTRVRWFDKQTGEELFDVPMQNESKHHFRDRSIYMMYSSDTEGYLLDIYVYSNVEKDIWLKGE